MSSWALRTESRVKGRLIFEGSAILLNGDGVNSCFWEGEKKERRKMYKQLHQTGASRVRCLEISGAEESPMILKCNERERGPCRSDVHMLSTKV